MPPIKHALLAWKGEGFLHAGDHCKKGFCKAYPNCRAWQEKYGELAGFEPLPPPAVLSDAELAEWLGRVQGLAQYAKDLEGYAQSALLCGRELPGWKLVQGRSTRKWTDQEAAFAKMEADGVSEALLYTRTPRFPVRGRKDDRQKEVCRTHGFVHHKSARRTQAGPCQRSAPGIQRIRGFYTRGELI